MIKFSPSFFQRKPVRTLFAGGFVLGVGLLGAISWQIFATPSAHSVGTQDVSAPESAQEMNLDATAVAAGADASWWVRVQQQLAAQEYEASPAVPEPLQAAMAAGLPGSEMLADAVRGRVLQTPNRRQNLRTYYLADRIAVVPRATTSPAWVLQMQTVGLGRGGAMAGLPAVTPEANGNRISYHRGGIEEWYVNDERGLEQGWTLQQRPEGAGELRVAVAVHGLDLRAAGAGIELIQGGSRVLEYGKLHVYDAEGRTLPASFEVAANTLSIRVDDRDAVYPVVIDPLLTTASWTAEGDKANAEFGYSVAGAGDVNGDGYADVVVGAPKYDNGMFQQGRAFVYLGGDGGLSATAPWVADGDKASARFGWSVAGAGDVDGDGYADVIVGAPGYTNGQSNEGRTYVYHGSATGLAATASWTVESNQAWAGFGSSVAGAGDVNGDGFADVIVGAYDYDTFEADRGAVFVYQGSVSGLSQTESWMVGGNWPGWWYGWSVAGAGDVNGDGYADVIIGAPKEVNALNEEGRADVYYGSSSGLAPAPSWTVFGWKTNAWLGYSVAGAGDVNGDGYADVIVGARRYTNGESEEGRALVYYGGASGLSLTASWSAEGNQATALFGTSVAGAGDVNGDGYADVIVGANWYDNGETNEGRAFVYHGSATGLSSTPVWTAESDQASAEFGWSVAGVGDVNGDGLSDVIVAAKLYDDVQTDAGRAYVYHGSAEGLTTTVAWADEGDQESAVFGTSVAGAGDVNGDGYDDVIVGASLFDNGETNEGRTYVYYGGAAGLNTTASWMAEGNQADVLFGSSVAGAGDVNGDGFDDIIVGAYGYDISGGSNEGRVYVYHGSVSGPVTMASWIAEGDQVSGWLGFSVASAGDVNGDGYADIIVGAPRYDNGDTDEGRAYVYHGSVAGLVTMASWVAESEQAGALFGYSVAGAGDVNGDGYTDVIIGAYEFTNVASKEGAAFAFRGSAAGLGTVPSWMVESNQASARLGYSVAGAGDVNGDGYADVIVGAPTFTNGHTSEGRASVYHGSATGLSGTASWTAEPNKGDSWFGRSVAGAGDVNGDGYADVIVGAYRFTNGESNEGGAFVYHGGAAGLNTTASWTVEGNQADAWFGASVAGVGDVNGDGYGDVVVGASRYDNGVTDEGRVFFYYGGGGPGRSVLVRQYQEDGVTILASGSATGTGSFVVAISTPTHVGRTWAGLAVEVKPATMPFDGTGLVTTTTALDFGDTTVQPRWYSAAVTLPAQGSYHWRARLLGKPTSGATSQGAGQWGRWLRPKRLAWQSADVRYMNQPPTLLTSVGTVISEGDSAASFAVAVTLSDADGDAATLAVDCNGNGLYGEFGEPELVAAAPGDHSLTCTDVDASSANGPGQVTGVARAMDASGRTVTALVVVAVDNVSPVISAVGNAGPLPEGNGGTVQINVTASDPVDALLYDYDCDNDATYEVNGQGAMYNCPYAAQNGPGAITVGVRVRDDAVSVTATTTVTVDNVSPTIQSVQISGGPYSAISTIPCTVNATDPADAVTITYDWKVNGAARGINQQTLSGGLAPGDKVRCVAIASDGDGGTAGPVESNEITLKTDRDGDGLPDTYETENGLDPDDPTDAAADTDGDGLTNTQEQAAGTDPQKADTDGDGVSDGDEVGAGSNPLDGSSVPSGDSGTDAGTDTDNGTDTGTDADSGSGSGNSGDTSGDAGSNGDTPQRPAAAGGCSVAPDGRSSQDLPLALLAMGLWMAGRRRRRPDSQG